MPNTWMAPDRPQKMPTKLNRETRLDSRPRLRLSVLSVKSRRSSATRWSGLSVPIAAAVDRQADVVIGAIRHPFGQEIARHPVAPADLQQLVHIDRIHREDDVHRGNLAEARHQPARCAAIQEQQLQERFPVLVLQRVVELPAPEAEHDAQPDQGQVHRDDRKQQAARGPLLLRRHEVRTGEPPGVFQEGADTTHERVISRLMGGFWFAERQATLRRACD